MTALETPPTMILTSPSPVEAQLEGFATQLKHTREWFLQQMDLQLAQLNSLRQSLEANAQFTPTPSMRKVLESPPSANSITLAAPDQPGIDPALEQATLAELNSALSLAFTEIASRGGMLMP